MLRLSFRMLWPDPHEIPKLYTASSVSENRFLHFIHTLSCSAHWWMSPAFGSFYRGHTTFKLDWKTWILPLSALQKLVSNSENFCTIFPYLKTKFTADMLFFQVYHFQGTSKSQMGQNILVLNKILLKSHTCYNLILCRKWLCRLQQPIVVASHCQ